MFKLRSVGENLLVGLNKSLLSVFLIFLLGISACKKEPVDLRIKEMEPAKSAELAKSIEARINPELSEGLTLSLWGVDSLVADPISIDIDNQGRIYYVRTNRQKNSEFDIRGHQDWEIG